MSIREYDPFCPSCLKEFDGYGDSLICPFCGYAVEFASTGPLEEGKAMVLFAWPGGRRIIDESIMKDERYIVEVEGMRGVLAAPFYSCNIPLKIGVHKVDIISLVKGVESYRKTINVQVPSTAKRVNIAFDSHSITLESGRTILTLDYNPREMEFQQSYTPWKMLVMPPRLYSYIKTNFGETKELAGETKEESINRNEEKIYHNNLELIECINCHEMIRKDSNYCKKCGAFNPLNKGWDTYVDDSPKVEKEGKGKKSKKIKILLWIICAAILLSGIAYWTITRPTIETNSKSIELVANNVPKSKSQDSNAPARKAPNGKTIGFSEIKVGQTVYWGCYEQNNNMADGLEPLEWLVLQKEDGYLELITVHVIDAKAFDTNGAAWTKSSIREWLNETFALSAFSDEELSLMIRSDSKGLAERTSTSDLVILPTSDRLQKLLGNDKKNLLGLPTKYAVSKGIVVDSNGYCSWRTREPMRVVGSDGEMERANEKTAKGIRPVIYIRIDKYKNVITK